MNKTKSIVYFTAIFAISLSLSFMSCGCSSNRQKENVARELWEETEGDICHVDTMFSEEFDSIMAHGSENAKDSIKGRIADLKAAIAEDAVNNAKRLYYEGKINEKDMEMFVKRWLHLQSLAPIYE